MVNIALWRADEYPATTEKRCVTIFVPDDDAFMPVLAALLRQAGIAANWTGEEAQVEGVSEQWLEAYDLTNWEGCEVAGMVQIDLFAINAAIIGAGKLTPTFSASLPFSYAQFTPNTSGAGFKNTCWLAQGSYVYSGQGSVSSNGGNTNIAVYDQSLVLVDTIQAGINQNGTFPARVTAAGTFDIPADGLYEIVVNNNGTGSGAGRQANWISHHIRQIS